MQNQPIQRRLFSRTAVVLATVLLGYAAAWAQPAATTTFTGATDTAWTDASNWDTGLPDASDDAWIGSGQTAVVTSATLDAAPFGTLTLGTNSTLQLSAAGKSGLPNAKTVYFSNGSYLQLTAGDINRSATYNVLAGATASFKPGNSGSDTIVNGSAVGASDSVMNIDINNVSIFRARWNASGFAGTMNYTSGSNQRMVELTSFATANTAVGPGTTSFGSNVRMQLGSSNRMSDSATVKLIGGAGGTNIKFDGVNDRSDTIANLIIESPVATSSPYIRMRNGFLTVTNGLTFQGTAGTVEIDNNLWPSIYNAGVSAINADIVFNGTGNWNITGDGQLRVNGATITTNTNATLSNLLVGTTSFTKDGAGSLTLNGDMSLFSGSINVTEGELITAGTIPGISVSTGAELTIGSLSSAADVLSLGAAGLTLEDGAAINWQYDGDTPGTYDSIVSTGTLDLTGLSNIIINGTSLGYDAQIGDVFTLFDGTVTGFDAGIFTLNLPALTTPGASWEIREGSLELAVIPEPSGILLTGIGVLGLCLRRRR